MSRLYRILAKHEPTRRDALKLLAAGIAALEVGCLERAGDLEIVPAVPEHNPGTPVRYASVVARDGFGVGVIAECRDGRPIKLDGNPAHPGTRGGSLPWLQARILDLYDPQRAHDARMAGAPAAVAQVMARLSEVDGPLWIVMPPQSSPAVTALLGAIAARRELHVVTDAPLDHAAAYRGAELAFGRRVEQQIDFARAERVVALDADPYATMPNAAAWARAAAAMRKPGPTMSRTWACQPAPTPTSTLADEPLAIAGGEVVCVAVAMLAELAARGLPVPAIDAAVVARARARLGAKQRWAREAAADLAASAGRGCVVVGDRQPAAVHALARWIDHACGNTRGPVAYTEPALAEPPGAATYADLVRGRADTIVVIDANPVYSAPRALDVGSALATARFSVHAGLRVDQTAIACSARVPLAHELEAWGCARAWDGTLAIAQPVIRPRWPAVSVIELLAALAGDARTPRDIVRATAGGGIDGVVGGERWAELLRAGTVPDTAAGPIAVTPVWSAALADAVAAEVMAERAGLEIAIAPHPHLHDGRDAGNAWLQELPHPITKQTWGNAAIVSPALAAQLGVSEDDTLRISTRDAIVDAPVLIVPGAADDAITLEAGYGQRVPAIPIADGLGADALALRDGERWLVRGEARAHGEPQPTARTQHEMTARVEELAPIVKPGEASPAKLRGPQPSLLPERVNHGVQWGMSIDTNTCTGCSACMIACQAENNIPTVGPEDVARGRHMAWIRIDRYVGDEGPVNEPVPCQHCENAPCEYVCPVNATAHSPDGLNEQVYNRCVGTRFCSNNCPYKVRRFNWFAYEQEGERALQYNPDVTVRSRGVMEKCTYCVQRIRRADHAALVEKRDIRPGEVMPACAQACPTQAITFGMLDEQGTAFAETRTDPRIFDLLHHLGTRPRTRYLARVVNKKEPA